MKNIKDAINNVNKKTMTFLMALTVVIIVAAGLIIYSRLAKPKTVSGRGESLQAVMNRLDRVMASLEKKDAFGSKTEEVLEKSGQSENVFSGILLRGVAITKGVTKVFLNNKILRVGDELDGYTVEEIKKDSVKLRDKDGNEKNISLEKK